MVKRHWKIFVLTLQRLPISFTLITIIGVIFSIRFVWIIPLLLLYLLYFKTHINYYVLGVFIIYFTLLIISNNNPMNEIDGEGKIVAIDYHETFQVNVIRYDTKKGMYYTVN